MLQAGVITTSEAICPKLSCSNPVQVEGQCCPSCPTCEVEGKTYSAGEIFHPYSDTCVTCECKVSVYLNISYNPVIKLLLIRINLRFFMQSYVSNMSKVSEWTCFCTSSVIYMYNIKICHWFYTFVILKQSVISFYTQVAVR